MIKKHADSKSCNEVIVCLSRYEMEKQFQEAYINKKFKQFQEEMKSIMYCRVSIAKDEDNCCECQVTEDIFVDGRSIQKVFEVLLNKKFGERIQVNCNCCLFKF